MTWKSHIAIATALSLPFSPQALPAAIAGSTAPDWIEIILRQFGINIPHRGQTHYIIWPVLIIIFSFFIDYKSLLFWFGFGYLTHWLADSLTISGVPVSPLSKNKITLFGGRLKTGEPLEYILSFGLLGISILIAKPFLNFTESELLPFNVYFMDWAKLYNLNIIDQKEYLEHRFKFF